MNLSVIVTIVAIVIVLGGTYEYMLFSNAAIQGLHDEYDMVIEARVIIGSDTQAGIMATGYNSPGWTSNTSSVDFGTLIPGELTKLTTVKITNKILPDVTRLHVRTDLSTQGVHLYVGETRNFFEATKVELSRPTLVNGITYQIPVSPGGSKYPAFAVMVDPGTAPQVVTFHIIVSYSYCND